MGGEGGEFQLPGKSLDLWEVMAGPATWSESRLERGKGGQVKLPGQSLDLREVREGRSSYLVRV